MNSWANANLGGLYFHTFLNFITNIRPNYQLLGCCIVTNEPCIKLNLKYYITD